jgi:hypothetical protein
MLPSKPRDVPRVNDLRVLDAIFGIGFQVRDGWLACGKCNSWMTTRSLARDEQIAICSSQSLRTDKFWALKSIRPIYFISDFP